MMKKTIPYHGRGAQEFLARHRKDVTGIVHGFDRLRLQGTLRSLYCPELMSEFLHRASVRWKDFKGYVCGITDQIRTAAVTLAEQTARPMHYLRSSALNKEAFIAALRQRDRIDQGLIAVLSVVEPCRTWFVRGNRQTQKLELRLQPGKCIHLYFYFVHPQPGLMHLRLQTWFPFQVHVYCNGRERLARELSRAGIAFTRQDNCLPSIADVPQAQAFLDAQVRQRWPKLLDPLIEQYHPTFRELREVMPLEYYWTVAQSEYATDVMFRDRAALQRIYPALVQHSIMSFGADRVLRFLGRKQAGSAVEVKSTLRRREEGVCVKHWLNQNSLKAYDKGSILRSEATMNEPASRVSRQLALLRAHGLIAKLGKTHRYKVTRKGRTIITAFLAAAHADTEQFTRLAA